MTPEERAENLVSKLFDGTGTLDKYEKVHLLDGIASEIRAAVEESEKLMLKSNQQAEWFAQMIPKVRAKAYEDAANLARSLFPHIPKPNTATVIADAIDEKAKEVAG